MAGRTTAQAILEAFREEGIKYVFGLPGWHVLSIYDGLADIPEIRTVTVKNENSASVMADVYARITREPAVVLLTAGPGALNSITGLAGAYHAAAPLLHLTGTVSLGSEKESIHGLDRDDFLHKAFQDVTKWSTRVDRPEDISEVLARAFFIARSGRPGPVHVDIPEDVMFANVSVPGYTRPAPSAVPMEPGLADRIAGLLQKASRPIICAGKGVLVCQAGGELRQLAEELGAPVAVSRDVIGVFPDGHPLYAGFFWKTESYPLARQLIEESDLVLAIGVRPGTLAASGLVALAGDRVAWVGFDDDSGVANAQDREPMGLINAKADSREFLRALLLTLEGSGKAVDSGPNDLVRRISRQRQLLTAVLKEEAERHRDAQPIYLGSLLQEIGDWLPPEVTLTTDIGNTDYGVRAYIPAPEWPRYIQPGAWAAMGFALPAAIASNLATSRPSLGITGDGALLMCVSELSTAVELGSNVVIVVVDDNRYGMINTLQMGRFGRSYGDAFVSPDFARLAESFGARGFHVERLSEVKDALEAAFAGNGPAVIDVVCDYRTAVPSMNRVGDLARHRSP